VSLPAGPQRVVDLAGTGPTDLWALAHAEGKNKGQAILLRFDGKAWAKGALPFALQTGAILPLSPTEAWLATDQGVVARFDGKAWKKALDAGGPGSRPLFVPLPKGGVALVGPKGALFLLEKGAFVKKDRGAPALRAACAAGEVRWAVGERGAIARWSGDGFERVAGVGEDDLFAVHGSSRDDVWAVGAQGAVLHRSDMEWKRVDAGLKGTLRGVFAASPEDVWVAGDGELAHWDGRAFASRYEASMGPLKGVCGRTGAEVYVVGDGGVWRYDGKAWQHVDTPAAYPLNAVTANADGSVWALGEGGMVRLENGTNWVEVGASKVNAPTVLFAGPAGPYVAGAQGVWRYDGKSWASVLSKLETVGGFASATDDVWALSKGDEARQWNGVGWRRSVTGAPSPLRAVWSRNGEAFAVGDGGAVLHFRP